jgi:hypothetical protein
VTLTRSLWYKIVGTLSSKKLGINLQELSWWAEILLLCLTPSSFSSFPSHLTLQRYYQTPLPAQPTPLVQEEWWLLKILICQKTCTAGTFASAAQTGPWLTVCIWVMSAHILAQSQKHPLSLISGWSYGFLCFKGIKHPICIQYSLTLLLYFIFYCCAGGVHCGSYKSSYNISNISYLNSPPPPFSFIPLPPLLE